MTLVKTGSKHYSITLQNNTTSGIVLSHTKAIEGTIVTVTCTSAGNDGCPGIYVECSVTGNTLYPGIIWNVNDSRTFTMPAEDVTVRIEDTGEPW